jgi:hypothetical protein
MDKCKLRCAHQDHVDTSTVLLLNHAVSMKVRCVVLLQ